jgi:hypothetical protein
MIIKKVLTYCRRDFTATLECEFCKAMDHLSSGYDDSNYHNNVLANRKCKNCDKSSISGKSKIIPKEPKYPENFVI